MSAAPAVSHETGRMVRPPPGPSRDRARRRSVLGLGIVGALLFVLSYAFPYWHFALYAPQYPKGLHLVIGLTGVSGDVAEINIINHYIGMHGLDKAAEVERALAGWGIGVAGVMVLLFLIGSGRRLNWLAALPALALPVGFVLDSMYWLYRFGHQLDPKAPLNIPPFTPTLFGPGKVGQFRTEAIPEMGFWLALLGATVVLAAVVLRKRVCETCPHFGTCGAVCAHGLVGAGQRLDPRP